MTRVEAMRTEYDFSKAKRNPYAKQLKQSVTMRLDTSTVDYFKGLAAELDVPYQTLINHYLRERTSWPRYAAASHCETSS